MPKYRLNFSSHVQNDANGVATQYVKGDVFESNDKMIAADTRRHTLVEDSAKVSPGIPLSSMKGNTNSSNNVTGLAAIKEKAGVEPKTAPLSSSAGTGADTLDSMTDAELRTYAKDEEIDVSKAKNRESLIKTIREAMKE